MIRFLWSEGVSGAEIHQHNTVSVLPQRSVYEWIEKLKNCRTSVTHEGSGTCVARCSAKNIFFSEGIKKLVQRWKKCIEKQGCYHKFSIFIEMKFVSVVRIIIDSPTYILAACPVAEVQADGTDGLYLNFGKQPPTYAT